MPFGGKTQRSPAQAMAADVPGSCPVRRRIRLSVMAWGCDPIADRAPIPTSAHTTRSYDIDGASSSPPAPTIRKPTSPSRSFSRSCVPSRSAGASPLLPCSARWTPSWSSALPPSAARTPCPARSIDLDVPPTLVSFAVAPLRRRTRSLSNGVQGRGSSSVPACPGTARRLPERRRRPHVETAARTRIAAGKVRRRYAPWTLAA